jgi:TonB family protein
MVVLAAVVLLIPLAAAAQDPPVPDLDRLVAEGGSATRVRDGVLRVRKGSGWVRTRRIFADFTLSAEVRLISAKSQVEIAINGQPAGRYTIDVLAGSLLFQATGDDAEVRSLSYAALPPTGVLANAEYKKQPDFNTPKLVKEAKPSYSRNAMAAKVQGTVHYEAVVLADGSVGGIWLTKLLHPELEHSGLAAVRKWLFTPGILNGSAVPVIIDIEMSFTLK